jgi:7,8-dihydro-6-hydroxymethylpterin-pyrophosphokinase
VPALTARNGPRAIDIDILYYDHDIISKSVLVVPHPSIYERDFVLRPLVEYGGTLEEFCSLIPYLVLPPRIATQSNK